SRDSGERSRSTSRRRSCWCGRRLDGESATCTSARKSGRTGSGPESRAGMSSGRAYADGAPPLVDLPAALGTTGAGPAGEICRERFVLDSGLTAGLRALATHEGVTASAVVATAFAVLLHRYTGQEDLALLWRASRRPREGAPVVGPPEAERLLRVAFPTDPSFREALSTISAAIDALGDGEFPVVPVDDRSGRESGGSLSHMGRVALHWSDSRRPAMETGVENIEDAGFERAPDRHGC